MVIWDGHVFMPKFLRTSGSKLEQPRLTLFGMPFWGELEEHQFVEHYIETHCGELTIVDNISDRGLILRNGIVNTFLITKKHGVCVVSLDSECADPKDSVKLVPINIKHLRAYYAFRGRDNSILSIINHLDTLDQVKEYLIGYDLIYSESTDIILDI